MSCKFDQLQRFIILVVGWQQQTNAGFLHSTSKAARFRGAVLPIRRRRTLQHGFALRGSPCRVVGGVVSRELLRASGHMSLPRAVRCTRHSEGAVPQSNSRGARQHALGVGPRTSPAGRFLAPFLPCFFVIRWDSFGEQATGCSELVPGVPAPRLVPEVSIHTVGRGLAVNCFDRVLIPANPTGRATLLSATCFPLFDRIGDCLLASGEPGEKGQA